MTPGATSFREAPGRILITKIGLDGHDRGSRIVASYLRDAGFEVIYTPPWQSTEAVVNIALQEDVELIGVSTLATDHLVIPDLVGELAAAGLDDIAVLVGGIVPESEQVLLHDVGVKAIFGPGATRDEIVAVAQSAITDVRERRGAAK